MSVQHMIAEIEQQRATLGTRAAQLANKLGDIEAQLVAVTRERDDLKTANNALSAQLEAFMPEADDGPEVEDREGVFDDRPVAQPARGPVPVRRVTSPMPGDPQPK